ncbi:MAG: sigma-70 family RNA polymerase sigma factor [Bacteroidales bacterium]|nr:sigma-70 family RNA polymerase sigma factor [Bacteroidales bacterium]
MHDRRLSWFNRLSDRQLVEMLLANDEEAVEYVFFHRCDGMFEHIVNSILPNGNKGELINEYYLYLREDDWRRLRQFEFRSGLNTWLTIVAIRFFNSKKSLAQTNDKALNSLPMDKAENVADDFDVYHEMSRVELYDAINRLSKPRERLALLGELMGKSAESIAEELGCTVAAVYNLTKKARKAVKKMMKGKDQ